jgi:L-threonylcarbamoyladenylate synthase
MYNTLVGVDISIAKSFLEKGELVAIPTETVYGLAANGLDSTAVLKIYAAKDRPQFNPLILHVANLEQLKQLVIEIPDACQKLINTFSPGPITYLLPKKAIVPDLVTAGSSHVAVRIPDHPLTLALISALKFPLAAPSANPSGYVSPVSSDHVLQGLRGKISYVLEGGPCRVGLESTIVGFNGSDVVVHRLGGISIEQIEQATGVVVTLALSHASPTAPGQLKSHYATTKPFLMGDVEQLSTDLETKKVGIISFKQSYLSLHPKLEFILSPNGNLDEAAAKLFGAMREMDASDVDVIIAERFPDQGIGKAINDRLERAAFNEIATPSK